MLTVRGSDEVEPVAAGFVPVELLPHPARAVIATRLVTPNVEKPTDRARGTDRDGIASSEEKGCSDTLRAANLGKHTLTF
jgi:hypothetical protein